jgi:hypothetical protein
MFNLFITHTITQNQNGKNNNYRWQHIFVYWQIN